MLSDALSDAPRASLPSPVNLQEFLQQAAARQVAERAQQEQRERQSVVWVSGLAGNAKRNSLGSVTTKRLSEKRSSATATPTAAGASKDEDAIGSLLRHLKLQEEKSSPRPAASGGSRRGSRNQPPGSPVKRLVQHQSAPSSKRPSLLLAQSDVTDKSQLSAAATPSNLSIVSPAASIPPLASPSSVISPNRRRRSIPRVPITASASHALPSVEHLRAIPFSRPSVLPHPPSTPTPPLASPAAHQSTSVAVSTVLAPTLLSPLHSPSSPTTRRSSMPCQSAGPMQRFWSDTRQAELNGRRNSGGKGVAEETKESSCGDAAQQQQQDDGGDVQVKPIKQVRWREEVEYEGSRPRAGSVDSVVIKTASDPSYAWLPIGARLLVEK